ncbi:hypothetical protein DERF_008516 [Dermatophagoides farinae]|uniref:Uncharacterized protein n=1 Tax=Dermatophagoides farinae TaxID=6954 RepID=A0A922I3L0_DERFA|nr:hypothetical protein DERF_008516 [Dermatophagoides farinae]
MANIKISLVNETSSFHYWIPGNHYPGGGHSFIHSLVWVLNEKFPVKFFFRSKQLHSTQASVSA